MNNSFLSNIYNVSHVFECENNKNKIGILAME